eukprot:403359796
MSMPLFQQLLPIKFLDPQKYSDAQSNQEFDDSISRALNQDFPDLQKLQFNNKIYYRNEVFQGTTNKNSQDLETNTSENNEHFQTSQQRQDSNYTINNYQTNFNLDQQTNHFPLTDKNKDLTFSPSFENQCEKVDKLYHNFRPVSPSHCLKIGIKKQLPQKQLSQEVFDRNPQQQEPVNDQTIDNKQKIVESMLQFQCNDEGEMDIGLVPTSQLQIQELENFQSIQPQSQQKNLHGNQMVLEIDTSQPFANPPCCRSSQNHSTNKFSKNQQTPNIQELVPQNQVIQQDVPQNEELQKVTPEIKIQNLYFNQNQMNNNIEGCMQTQNKKTYVDMNFSTQVKTSMPIISVDQQRVKENQMRLYQLRQEQACSKQKRTFYEVISSQISHNFTQNEGVILTNLKISEDQLHISSLQQQHDCKVLDMLEVNQKKRDLKLQARTEHKEQSGRGRPTKNPKIEIYEKQPFAKDLKSVIRKWRKLVQNEFTRKVGLQANNFHSIMIQQFGEVEYQNFETLVFSQGKYKSSSDKQPDGSAILGSSIKKQISEAEESQDIISLLISTYNLRRLQKFFEKRIHREAFKYFQKTLQQTIDREFEKRNELTEALGFIIRMSDLMEGIAQ